MGKSADRMWDIRDAVLLWLYEEAASGQRHPRIDIEAIHSTAGWAADPIGDDEIAGATTYLKSEGYISGPEAWGAGVIRPAITSRGENQAATGISVRPGADRPANVTGVTNNFNITTNGHTNLAVNSSGVTQSITVKEKAQRVVDVAAALDTYAADEPTNVDQARQIAAELRDSASNPEENKLKLRALLGGAVATVAVAAGTELGQQVTDLAVGALQSLG